MSKPSLPEGTRDFGPDIVRKRNYILNTIREVFELYGFQPLETPAMENLETLMGKYGEEGDRLIFRILNNGLADPKNVEKAEAGFRNLLAGRSDRNLTGRALRYDLTIPFARYVAMNHGRLVFPFRRYQVQPVWRADRPQRGRYREFYQCDADVVGSRSLLNDVEFVHLYHDVFMRLRLEGYELRINSRKLLAALAERCGGVDKLTDITVAVDKLDKIGPEGVVAELSSRGLSEAQIGVINRFLAVAGDNAERLAQAGALLTGVRGAEEGIAELRFILERVGAGIPLKVDFTLARGLNYYTGAIFEVRAPASVSIGSIGGGGRYDDLTGLFGVKDVPGVGISFGVDRIYDVLRELDLFPKEVELTTQVLFLNSGMEAADRSLELLKALRARGVRAELYPDEHKVAAQYKYAEGKGIPFVAGVADGGSVQLKDIRNGEVRKLDAEGLLALAFE